MAERLRVAVLNGPNLDLLGTREPEIYGSATLADIECRLRNVAAELDVDLSFAQFNGEGQLIDAIHALRDAASGAVVNAAAYSHTSLAIRDALVAVAVPFVEVHITNVHAREHERHRLVLASRAVGVICGLGVYGYEAGVRGLVRHLRGA